MSPCSLETSPLEPACVRALSCGNKGIRSLRRNPPPHSEVVAYSEILKSV